MTIITKDQLLTFIDGAIQRNPGCAPVLKVVRYRAQFLRPDNE